jgi:hypothetical protein
MQGAGTLPALEYFLPRGYLNHITFDKWLSSRFLPFLSLALQRAHQELGCRNKDRFAKGAPLIDHNLYKASEAVSDNEGIFANLFEGERHSRDKQVCLQSERAKPLPLMYVRKLR